MEIRSVRANGPFIGPSRSFGKLKARAIGDVRSPIPKVLSRNLLSRNSLLARIAVVERCGDAYPFDWASG